MRFLVMFVTAVGMQFLWTGKYPDLKLIYFCLFQGLSHIRPQAGIGEEVTMEYLSHGA